MNGGTKAKPYERRVTKATTRGSIGTTMTTRGSLGKDKSTPEYKKYKKYLKKLKKFEPSCNIDNVLTDFSDKISINKQIIEDKSGKDIDDFNINELINGFMNINMTGGGKIRGGGFGIPISSVYLIEILKKLK